MRPYGSKAKEPARRRRYKMGDAVIQVEGLGKRFHIGKLKAASSLGDALIHAVKAPLRSFGRRAKDEDTILWALRDVSFEVKQGEVVGLIGRNGAGKSTLLKILARITRPTEGRAELRGRIASLLEVGTGFHPELTGRENIFLSGAVLGMKKAEIQKKFDEIVAFSEVERFLETPLKHYSSGMQMRLAFAVAAHLEPEILLVDEVLTVGDLNFQKKCLGKMSEVAGHGRTIVFVSHQMNQIRRLCSRALWVDGGGIRMNGSTAEALAAYELAMYGGDRASGMAQRTGTVAQFRRWQIVGPQEERGTVLTTTGPATVAFVAEVAKHVRAGVLGVALFNPQRQLMWSHAVRGLLLEPGVHTFSYSFDSIPLRPGAYEWQVSLWDGEKQLDLWDCSPAMVIATEVHQHYRDEWNGILNMPSRFRHGLPDEDLAMNPVRDGEAAWS